MKQQAHLRLEARPVQELAQQCSLCKQNIGANRQMPLNTLIIERYAMCPNCRQPVTREIEQAYWYRRKWFSFVQGIAKKNGWEYRAGIGFRPASR